MRYYQHLPTGAFYAWAISPPLIYKLTNGFVEVSTSTITNTVPAPFLHQCSINHRETWPFDTSMLDGVPEGDDDYGELTISPGGIPQAELSEAQNSAKDFNQRYSDTYVLARETGEKSILLTPEVVRVIALAPSDCVTFSKDGKKTYQTPFENFIILQGIPSNKLINSEFGHVVEFSRIPERQWKRGVCSNTFHANAPSRWDREALIQSFKGTQYLIKSSKDKGFSSMIGNSDRVYTHFNMKELFSPTYPSYEKAIEMLGSGTHYSAAITERAYISHSPRTKNYIIAIGSSKVGEIPPKQPDTIIIKEKLLQQEVLDLVKRNHLNVKVVE